MGRCATRTSGLTARKLTHVVAGACWDVVSRPGLNPVVALAICAKPVPSRRLDPKHFIKHFDRSVGRPTRRESGVVRTVTLPNLRVTRSLLDEDSRMP